MQKATTMNEVQDRLQGENDRGEIIGSNRYLRGYHVEKPSGPFLGLIVMSH
jgi:hypothetical protein